MLTADQILEKLYQQPERFRKLMQNKEWHAAYWCRRWTATVALFCEIGDRHTMKLFGSRPYAGDKEEWEDGLFREKDVEKVSYQCVIKGNGEVLFVPEENDYCIGDRILGTTSSPYEIVNKGTITDKGVLHCTKSRKYINVYEIDNSGKYMELKGEKYGKVQRLII